MSKRIWNKICFAQYVIHDSIDSFVDKDTFWKILKKWKEKRYPKCTQPDSKPWDNLPFTEVQLCAMSDIKGSNFDPDMELVNKIWTRVVKIISNKFNLIKQPKKETELFYVKKIHPIPNFDESFKVSKIQDWLMVILISWENELLITILFWKRH